ncbi:3325_t:CDS:10 [Dentiscutata erythropus]|uniref:3325_t:CDS:1 n=1 Tax=Dentiscutata erythropus TaxID=1348616 RepID=A0A9N9JAW2_9GLOM|nr:3325_t:CDS:10 [Dentiscutata erythropus]
MSSGKKIDKSNLTIPSGSIDREIISMQPSEIQQMQTQPSYAETFPLDGVPHGCYSTMINSLGNLCGFVGSIPILCCCCFNPFQRVTQGNVGLISRFGRFYKIVDPGLTKVNIITEKLISVDMRIQITEIPRQAIMTKDNVYVHIDSVLYWHIIDPYQATFGVTDIRRALIDRTQTTLRHTLGTRVLQDCIESREAIAVEIKEMIDEPAHGWGVKVENILIRDILFSSDLQKSLSSAAQQKRIGESKVILAQAEVDSAKLMRQAAEILNSPAAMQIRYLEAMTTMSKSSGSKVIFMPYSPGQVQFGATNESGSSSFGTFNPVTASIYETIADKQ